MSSKGNTSAVAGVAHWLEPYLPTEGSVLPWLVWLSGLKGTCPGCRLQALIGAGEGYAGGNQLISHIGVSVSPPPFLSEIHTHIHTYILKNSALS